MRTLEEDIIPLEACQCEEILEVVIMPLAHHFLALGENNKALYYFLEIASAYLIMDDNYMVSSFCPAAPALGTTPRPRPEGGAPHAAASHSCPRQRLLLLQIRWLRREMT